MRRAATTVLLALLAGCSTKSVGRPPCMNHVLHESVAPGGNEKAVIFERDCMTGATIQVSLVPTVARAPSEPGNVFAVGAGKHAVQGRTVVTVAWSGPAKLTISYTKGAAVSINLAGKNSDGTQMATPFNLTSQTLGNQAMTPPLDGVAAWSARPGS